jgi:Transposase DDE domain
MAGSVSLLVTLVGLLDAIPQPPPPATRGPGAPRCHPDRLFLKALGIMIVRHLHTDHELLAVRAEPTAAMRALRRRLSRDGRFPGRRTWERRLAALPATLPTQIGCLGRELVAQVQPWLTHGRAAAMDSTVLRARGGVWPKAHREAGVVPHTSIDIEAHWTESGGHGWVDGWKPHRITTVAGVWLPLAAALTPAHGDAAATALVLLDELPAEVRFLLGDRHYNTPDLRRRCADDGRILVTSRYGRYPHPDAGVEVRRAFRKLRSVAIEHFNEHVTGIFDGHGPVCTRGMGNTARFALGAVVVYQLALLYRHEHGLPLNVGLKAFLKAA